MYASTMASEFHRVEWVGGLVSMPNYITGEGEPYRPELLLWLGPNGAVLGSEVVKPGEALGRAVESLRKTFDEPVYGRPHRPARLRVASAELAAVLRAGDVEVDIVCAATPELDEVTAALAEHLRDDSELERSHLSPGISADAVSAFFEAAAELFRAKPWHVVPRPEGLISASIEELGLRNAALSVIGQQGQHLGLGVYEDADAFDDLLDAAGAISRGEKVEVPAHIALNFERGADIEPSLRKEVLQHGWAVAGPDAYPWLVSVDEDAVACPATAEQLTIAEALSRALVKLVSEPEAVIAACNGGEALERTLRVSTHAGEYAVRLRVPFERASDRFRPPYNLRAHLVDLVESDDELDLDVLGELEAELMRRFQASEEGKSLTDPYACTILMELAALHLGETIATLDEGGLEEVLFDITPRKVSIVPSAASEVIEQLRAFYTFLQRELLLEQADACLDVLDDDAARDLRTLLADQTNYGPAKSLLMEGRKAGFDMSTQKGINAWMRVVESRGLAASEASPRVQSAKAAQHKKKQRKAERKARKKNRR